MTAGDRTVAMRSRILRAALLCARTEGVQWITRDQVAAAAQVAPGLVNYYFETMRDLKRAVFAAAVQEQVLPLIAQGLADGNQACKDAPEWLRKKALESIK